MLHIFIDFWEQETPYIDLGIGSPGSAHRHYTRVLCISFWPLETHQISLDLARWKHNANFGVLRRLRSRFSGFKCLGSDHQTQQTSPPKVARSLVLNNKQENWALNATENKFSLRGVKRCQRQYFKPRVRMNFSSRRNFSFKVTWQSNSILSRNHGVVLHVAVRCPFLVEKFPMPGFGPGSCGWKTTYSNQLDTREIHQKPAPTFFPCEKYSVPYLDKNTDISRFDHFSWFKTR